MNSLSRKSVGDRYCSSCASAIPEDVTLQKLLTKLKLSLPALKKQPTSELTTVDIIEHTILYIRELWKILEENDPSPGIEDTASVLSPTKHLKFSYLAVQ